MGSALDRDAVETYIADMMRQFGSLLAEHGHPLANEVAALAGRIEAPVKGQGLETAKPSV